MENLSAEVERVFRDCLYTPDEVEKLGEAWIKENCVRAMGITCEVGFQPARLHLHEAAIRSFVDEMAPEFFADSGGGWTFLNLAIDRHGAQWTDLHQRMEQLVQLAIASGMARYCLPRELWSSLPGAVPYIVFTREVNSVAQEKDHGRDTAMPSLR